MSKIGLFYGSDTGNTERAAEVIQGLLGESNVDLHDVVNATTRDIEAYDKLILGQPTWYCGELQSNWEDFWPDFKAANFSGKQVAFFGLGDQLEYGEFFLDAMGLMHDVVLRNGGEPVGYFPTEGFLYQSSKAEVEGGEFFVGLALDEDQQPEASAERIQNWVEQVSEEMSL
ncbi:MAG: flavodoxin I [Thiomicrorhabdus sp.]|nr:MAG: flavodoxin I [Thiomicrorhabdus sp.]